MINVIWPRWVNGIAISFIFVPLTTSTMSQLAQEQMGNATGLYNLMRNIGGSIGIAFVTTMLARGAQAHQALMVGTLRRRPGVRAAASPPPNTCWPAHRSRDRHAQAYSIIYHAPPAGAFVGVRGQLPAVRPAGACSPVDFPVQTRAARQNRRRLPCIEL